jgi:hypothetical protein
LKFCEKIGKTVIERHQVILTAFGTATMKEAGVPANSSGSKKG